jgi:SAM-dependent methyltransferase
MADCVAEAYEISGARFASGRLLDLGCGSVPLYGIYRSHVKEVTCVDWGEGLHLDLQCDLSQPLSFGDQVFDTVVLSDVLEHIPNPDQLWSEIYRVLAPGGHLIMNVPFFYWLHAQPHDYYRYTEFALTRFAIENGFEIVELRALGGLGEVIADISAKLWSKVPIVGDSVAVAIQSMVRRLSRTRVGTRAAVVSAKNFPFAYFLVAQRAMVRDDSPG